MLLLKLAEDLGVVSMLVGESSLAATADGMVVATHDDSYAERRNISAAIGVCCSLGRFVRREYFGKYSPATDALDRGARLLSQLRSTILCRWHVLIGCSEGTRLAACLSCSAVRRQ